LPDLSFLGGIREQSRREANPIAASVEAHVTARITHELIGRADLIVVMEFMQCVDLLKNFQRLNARYFGSVIFIRGWAEKFGISTAEPMRILNFVFE